MPLAQALAATAGRELDLIGLGEAMVELWSEGPLANADSLRRAYGGDVLNSLVMAARLGAATGFITRVGDDPFGPALRDAWRAEGVDVSQAPLVAAGDGGDGVNGVYFISRLPGGEREFSYRRCRSAAAGLAPSDIDEAYLARARVLLLSGITQAISASAQAAALHAARLARAHGVVVAFDPNYRQALWLARSQAGAGRAGADPAEAVAARGRAAAAGTAPLDLARAAFVELLPHVDLLLVSEPTDLPVVASEPEVAEDGGGAYHYRSGPLALGIKRGAEGGELVLDGRSYAASAADVTVVDTTGAGDAWNAGLIHALLDGREPAQAVRRANAVAAWQVARYGAVPALDGPSRRSLHGALGA